MALPAEHGGWGLTLEPGILGLLIAPSLGGACLALGAMVAFLARTPLKIVVVDRRRGRVLERTRLAQRVAAGELAVLALLAIGAVLLAEPGFWVPGIVASADSSPSKVGSRSARVGGGSFPNLPVRSACVRSPRWWCSRTGTAPGSRRVSGSCSPHGWPPRSPTFGHRSPASTTGPRKPVPRPPATWLRSRSQLRRSAWTTASLLVRRRCWPSSLSNDSAAADRFLVR